MPWLADHGRIVIVPDSSGKYKSYLIFEVSRIEMAFLCTMVVSRSWMR